MHYCFVIIRFNPRTFQQLNQESYFKSGTKYSCLGTKIPTLRKVQIINQHKTIKYFFLQWAIFDF